MQDAAANHLTPLWGQATSRRPGTAAVSALWRYQDVRTHLMRAAELITARAAERRVLMLENPALPGTGCIGGTLVAGMQLILPGENAPVHRHAANALTFIVEGEGAYSTIGGERVAMSPGDLVVTRGWEWHGHGNTGCNPVIWMGGLDVPLARLFGVHFRESHPEGGPPVSPPECDSERKHGSVCKYDYMREGLERLAKSEPPHPSHGYRLRYANPADGSQPFPTLTAFLRWLPAGFSGASYRSTECNVFNVAEGRGTVHIDDVDFGFLPHDIFVVPPWASYHLIAETDCVLFSYSDRAAQEALGFWREQA